MSSQSYLLVYEIQRVSPLPSLNKLGNVLRVFLSRGADLGFWLTNCCAAWKLNPLLKAMLCTRLTNSSHSCIYQYIFQNIRDRSIHKICFVCAALARAPVSKMMSERASTFYIWLSLCSRKDHQKYWGKGQLMAVEMIWESALRTPHPSIELWCIVISYGDFSYCK